MSYTDADFLAWDPFDGERDVDIRCRTVKIVTTRVPQKCVGPDGPADAHQIAPGTRARVERAIVDGEWGSYYICVSCMAAWLKERGIPARDALPVGTEPRTIGVEDDCEDQAITQIEDTRCWHNLSCGGAKLEVMEHDNGDGSLWWRCPKCGGYYGEALEQRRESLK